MFWTENLLHRRELLPYWKRAHKWQQNHSQLSNSFHISIKIWLSWIWPEVSRSWIVFNLNIVFFFSSFFLNFSVSWGIFLFLISIIYIPSFRLKHLFTVNRLIHFICVIHTGSFLSKQISDVLKQLSSIIIAAIQSKIQ